MTRLHCLSIWQRIAEREMDAMARKLPLALDALIDIIERENLSMPHAPGMLQAGDVRLLRTIQHLVVKEMLVQIAPKTAPQ